MGTGVVVWFAFAFFLFDDGTTAQGIGKVPFKTEAECRARVAPENAAMMEKALERGLVAYAATCQAIEVLPAPSPELVGGKVPRKSGPTI